MVPYWRHGLDTVRREPPSRARRRRRRRRRRRPRARRAPDRPAGVGDPADAARRAVGRRRRDHARARARLGRAAPARREPDFVVTPGTGRRRRSSACTGAAPAGDRRGARRRASTSACPSSSRPASSRPPAASGVSVNAWLVRAAAAAVAARRPRPRASAAAASASPSPAGCADRPAAASHTPMTSNLTMQEDLSMPTFDTPEPISATIDLAVGDVRISRQRRGTTPSSTCAPATRPTTRTSRPPSRPASSTPSGQLLVKAPKLRSWSLRGGGPSIDVTIELPAGSNVHGTLGVGRLPLRRAGSASAGSRPASATSGSTRRDALSLKTGAGDITRRARHRPRRGHDRLGRRARRRARRAAP